MKKALVTGGMGFIGSHLAHELLQQGFEVTILDKSIYKPVQFDLSAARIIEGDMMAKELLKSCLEEVDVCFHLAAIASVVQCNQDWLYSLQNNVIAFNNLLDVLKNLKKPIKLVYASSAAVYGNSDNLPFDENALPAPVSTYGVDKLTNELYAAIASSTFGIPSVGLRLFNVYGLGQLDSNPYSGVITCFKKAILAKQPLIIYGDGEQTRDFIYVKDVVNAFIRAAQTPDSLTKVVNICSGKAISINELAEVMLDLFNVKLQILHKAARIGDSLHSLGDGKQAKIYLDFQASTPIQEGLKSLL